MNKQLLRDLCALDAISGREDAVRNYILDTLRSHTTPMDISVDAMGNVLVHIFGKEKGRKVLLLDAHMDEVGIVVTHIREDGLLGFDTVGGIDKQVLFGHRVRFGTQCGVIGGKATHQCKGDERKSVPATDATYIDIGAADADTARSLVQVGEFGTFDSEWIDLENGFFKAKAIDDRVGCAILLELAAKQPLYDLWLSFSVQEEIGLRGAGVAAEAIRPDVAIALDATTASDIAGTPEEQMVCRALGGAVVSFADRATLYDSDLYRQIRQLAEDKGIKTQTKNRIAGGNNAGAIQRSHTGVRMAAVSLPCRYIHSGSSVGNWQDVEEMEKLIAALAEVLPV